MTFPDEKFQAQTAKNAVQTTEWLSDFRTVEIHLSLVK